jgi:hypothetical protein
MYGTEYFRLAVTFIGHDIVAGAKYSVRQGGFCDVFKGMAS